MKAYILVFEIENNPLKKFIQIKVKFRNELLHIFLVDNTMAILVYILGSGLILVLDLFVPYICNFYDILHFDLKYFPRIIHARGWINFIHVYLEIE